MSEGGRLRAFRDRLAARLPGRRAARALAALAALSLTAASPWWGPAALAELRYFRVRRIEIVGATYLAPREVVQRLAVDTTQSVWLDLEALERRVAVLPQVKEVRLERKLPGTLVVRVTEHLPVALVPGREGLTPYDARGVALPIDPSRADLDVPVVEKRDTAAFRLLAELRDRDPSLFARVSELRRTGRGDDIALVVPPFLVRATADLTATRLVDILPVESDLARRQVRIAELDLRFRDQVVARLQ